MYFQSKPVFSRLDIKVKSIKVKITANWLNFRSNFLTKEINLASNAETAPVI